LSRPKKGTILPLSQKEKIPSSENSSTPETQEAPANEQVKQDLAQLGNQYSEAKTEGEGKKPRSAYKSRKEQEANEAAAKEAAQRADIVATADAFGEVYCQLIDLLLVRCPNPEKLTELEKPGLQAAFSKAAAKYIGVEFKYKEEIVLLTVTGAVVIPRFIRSK